MIYTDEYVDKVINYTYSIKKRIDILLALDANQYCNSGIDATITEKQTIKRNSRYIYRAIAKLKPSMGKRLLLAQDK
jgi:hypothetical protein